MDNFFEECLLAYRDSVMTPKLAEEYYDKYNAVIGVLCFEGFLESSGKDYYKVTEEGVKWLSIRQKARELVNG